MTGRHLMRLFIAIELPDDLKTALSRLRVDVPGARWVPPEQLHLTLAFLGEVEEKTAGELSERLALIHTPQFQLFFSGTGCFPNRRRPRVLWAGLEPNPRLMRLAAGVHGAVLACGIPQEERPFSPHITLARLKFPAAREVDTFLKMPQKLKLPPFPVREVILFQSLLTQGAVHIPVRSFSLADPAAEAGATHPAPRSPSRGCP
jgi:2'-5' RNA ligase